MCSSRIHRLRSVLDQESLTRLRNAADAAQTLENRWKQRAKDLFTQLEDQIFAHIEKYGQPPKRLNFNDFITEHAFEAMALGFKTAYTREQNAEVPYQVMVQMAKVPYQKVPRSFRDLMAQWDKWRKKKVVPARQRILAERIEKSYLKKVHDVWKRNSEGFRLGNEASQAEVRRKIRQASGTTYSRASTIIQTETTRHYNEVRREIYDQSNDVTHYLYVAIRDSATTKWCKSRQGKVFEKGSELLEENTPPVHWNCRSEILPLTPANPRHLILINDKSRRAVRSRLVPLPEGWAS